MQMLYRLFCLPFLIVLLNSHSTAQNKSYAVSIQLAGIDYFGLQTGHYFLHTNKNKHQKLYWDPALQTTFMKSITQKISIHTALTFSGLQMPLLKNDSSYIAKKEASAASTPKLNLPFIAIDAGFSYSLIGGQKGVIHPLVKTGLGYYAHSAGSGVTTYFGLGCNLKLSKQLYLSAQSDLHYSLSNRYQSRLQHAAGLKFYFRNGTENSIHIASSEKTNKSPSKVRDFISNLSPAKPLPRDSDGDGIMDEEDRCPTQAGKKEWNGCPDTDNDSIPDHKDLCPHLAGAVVMNGCPDKDDDQVTDDKDKCPDIKGLMALKGCPDSDTDGIADILDKCPSTFAKTEDGCPEPPVIEPPTPLIDAVQLRQKESAKRVREAAKQILFQPYSYTLDSSVFFALDTIASILKADSLLLLDIEGHTDSSGNAEKNLQLSQNRADACKEYLVKKGIEEHRISSVGYGDMNPIADNSTPEGRSANRRTDFLLHLPEKE
jgi:OOP family OmpA-OmpF porin